MLQRIALSLGTIALVAGVGIASTGAFFNDTETSTGNTFAAGDIDLKIDNTSYALDFNMPSVVNPIGAFIANPANTWPLVDLTTQKFFNFTDVKPGDYGEDTISIHVGSNNAWMCAAARITTDIDNTCTEPELADDPSCVAPNTAGELDSALKFAFWADDGDNVYEPVAGANGGVAETIFLGGSLADLNSAGQIALASPAAGAFGTSPVPGNSTVYIGKIWCAGNLVPGALVQNGTNGVISPITTQGTGFTCNGAAVNNAAQTDSVTGDMQFYAVQARNNANFSCTSYVPSWPEIPPQQPN